jgi:hypothetical protein
MLLVWQLYAGQCGKLEIELVLKKKKKVHQVTS